MKACDATAICFDERHEATASAVVSLAQASTAANGNSDDSKVSQDLRSTETTRIRIPWTSVDDIRRLEKEAPRDESHFTSINAQEADDIVLYGHSSGTSTGLPKPIPITSRDEIGALPRFHQMESKSPRPSTFTTTPIYTGGLADLWRSWSAAATLWTFPEDEVPVTGENVMRFLEAAQLWLQRENNAEKSATIAYVSCVPFVVQMMAEDERLMKLLLQMNIVGVGGAAMPTELGDKLVRKGVNLVSRFGSRECGFLLSSNRDFSVDKEWQYLRKHSQVDSFVFRKWNDTDYELVVMENWPSLSPAIRTKLPFNSHDVFQPHLSIPNAWRYCGRSDVQIALITGKKFDPAGIESALCTSQWIQDAVIVGDNRQYPAALIFLSIAAESLTESERSHEILKAVKKVNESCPYHARIEPDMISVLSSSEAAKIQKSGKGTVMRGKFAAAFKNEIQDLYEGPVAEENGAPLEQEDLETRIKIISTIIRSQVQEDSLDLDSNFYDKGIDSMKCMQIRNRIKSRLSTTAASLLSLNVVYEAGSTRRLAEVVGNLGPSSEFDSNVLSEDRETRLSSLVDKHVKFQSPSFQNLASKFSAAIVEHEERGRVVLLTGATGFLGSHILSELLQMPDISQIILPVRVSSKSREKFSVLAQHRVQSALESYHLLSPNQQGPSLQYFPSDLNSPTLGLETLDMLLNITDVIHAAWAVNFNIPLESFESQLNGLINLYNVAKLAETKREPSEVNGSSQCSFQPVSFAFCSSTASVVSCDHLSIPESVSKDSKTASGTGYGYSKWVAESILDHLAQSTSSRPQVRILRIGQLCGSTKSGIWNRQEAWPLMLDVGIRHMSGKLPDLHAAGLGRLDWLPVDLAARSILEIAFQPRKRRAPDVDLGALVYHVANSSSSGTTWRDVQDWLVGLDADEIGSGIKESIRIVPVEMWLDSLDNLEQNHRAKHLIKLWRSGWSRMNQAPGESGSEVREKGNLAFGTVNAESLSMTMRAKENMNISKDAFQRMLGWVLRRAVKEE